MFGIYAPYANNEPTQVANRIARWAEARCVPYSVYSYLPVVRPVGMAADEKVASTRGLPQDVWEASCSSVLWTFVPSYGCLSRLVPRSIRSYVYIDPRSLRSQHRELLPLASVVLSPSDNFASFLRKRWRLPRVEVCPYAAGLIPQSREEQRSRVLRVALPLVGPAAGDMEWALPMLLSCMRRNGHVHGRVIVTPSRICSRIQQLLRHAKRFFAGRLDVVRSSDGFYYGHQFLDVDLLFWPTVHAGVGCVPSLAASMGVPTLAMDVPPMDEYLRRFSGYLVHVPYRVYDKVHRIASPDPQGLCDRLEDLVQDPAKLRKQSRLVRQAAAAVETAFDAVLDRLVGG